MNKIRTRFAPSPTGSLHIGGLRTALYSYALAKHSGGDFLLRIEDTDQKREVEGGKEQILDILKKFNLNWDEQVYIQSELAKDNRYKNAAEKLVAEGHAFYCQCDAKNAKKDGFSNELRDPCRGKNLTSGAVKLMVPNGEGVAFTDFVLGKKVSWGTSTVGDATLLKSDGFPTYHLAVVVDDHEMNITHVLRGHDWMPSTPIHLLVYKYLDYDLPEIGHLTDILDPDGGKLSKRKGSTSCEGLLNEGYLMEAILNFVMLLGWAPKDNQEIFSLQEFVKAFDQSGLQKSNPAFNREKLDWFNGQYIRQLHDNKFIEKLEDRNSYFAALNDDKKMQITQLIKDRIKKFSEFEDIAGFFWKRPDLSNISHKDFSLDYSNHLHDAMFTINKLEDWNLEKLNEKFMGVIKEKGYKTSDFFMDLRVAITGKKFTPPINESIIILGHDESFDRILKILD